MIIMGFGAVVHEILAAERPFPDMGWFGPLVLVLLRLRFPLGACGEAG